MHSSEYEDLLASVQKIVRQAYDMGRADALKQVVEVLKTDPVPPKPLALAAPDPHAPTVAMPGLAKPEPAPGLAPASKPVDGPANHSSQPPTTHTRGVPDVAPVSNSAPDGPRKDVSAVGILDTPAKTPDAPARTEDKPKVPWWAR